jgi:hypothetical protein
MQNSRIKRHEKLERKLGTIESSHCEIQKKIPETLKHREEIQPIVGLKCLKTNVCNRKSKTRMNKQQ